MLKLVTAFLVAMAALFTFSVFTVMAAYAGMRIERSRVKYEQQQKHLMASVRLVSEALRVARAAAKAERPVPDAATRKAANA